MALSENPTLEEIVDEVERLNNLIVNRGGAQTITPSTSNKTLNKGYYKGNITIKGDANLIASNIVNGKSIFGVKGNVTVASLGGKKWASGTTSSKVFGSSNVGIQINNLSFKPNLVYAYRYVDNATYQTYSVMSRYGGILRGARVQKASSSASIVGYIYNVYEYSGTIDYDKYYFGDNWFKIKTSSSGTNLDSYVWYAFE